MKLTKCIAVIVVSLLFARFASADFDVSPSVSGGRIITNGFDDGTSTFQPNQRVFDYAFDDPDNPFFTQDPGFHPQPGSGFPTGSTLHISVLSGLSYWNGNGNVNFGSVPAGETLQLTKGSSSIIVGNTPPVPSGFAVAPPFPASGEFDEHLESSLLGLSGADPTTGVYLIQAQLYSSDATIQDSLPFDILYNNGVSDAAIDQARAALVPEPGILPLLGVGAIGMLRGRKTRR